MKKEDVVKGVESILERIDAVLDSLRVDERFDPLPEICEILDSLLPLLPEIAPYVVQHYEHASDERDGQALDLVRQRERDDRADRDQNPNRQHTQWPRRCAGAHAPILAAPAKSGRNIGR